MPAAVEAASAFATLGLVELLFTFAIGRLVFRETPTARELTGAALLAALSGYQKGSDPRQ